MKYLVGILLLCLLASCKKASLEDQCIKVRRVARVCKQTVLQVMDPRFYHIGEDNWVNLQAGGEVYDHVFLVENIGAFDQSIINQELRLPNTGVSQEFTVKAGDSQDVTNWAYCQAVLPGAPPAKRHKVLVSFNCE